MKYSRIKKALSLICATSVLLCSCATNTVHQYERVKIKDVDQIQSVTAIPYPMIAEIKVDTAKVKHTVQPIIDCNAEANAYNSALEKFSIDGILNPTFSCSWVGPNSKENSLTVSGYPFKYIEFRKMTEADKHLLTDSNKVWIQVQPNSYLTSVSLAEKPNTSSGNGVIWGILGGALLLIVIVAGAS